MGVNGYPPAMGNGYRITINGQPIEGDVTFQWPSADGNQSLTLYGQPVVSSLDFDTAKPAPDPRIDPQRKIDV